jgi:histidinol dehydrogenase
VKTRIVQWKPGSRSKVVEAFLCRPAVDANAEESARRVLDAVRKDGDRAVRRFAKQFDGADLAPGDFRVGPDAFRDARRAVDASFQRSARETCRRVREFARRSMRPDWSMKTGGGGSLGERFLPLQRVGAYIPGGSAPLVSTALMTIPIAREAGVPEIVACTPAGRDGRVNPYTLFALELAGATEVYRIGGIHAIGAMAYGTETIRPVRKIVGPGGPYVTAAKRLVYGSVGLDMVAGPSEIAVLADTTARPEWVAADLLSQAEHGTGHEKVLFVTPEAGLARAVRDELERQADALPRRDVIRRVLAEGALIAVVPSVEDGIELCNRFAPEHMELIVENAARRARGVRTAGALFVGPWTPESVGDFAAGPSHVLPTGGTAAVFSGLTVEDFRRRMSVIRYTKQDLREARTVIEDFGRVETLDAHARSATIRLSAGRAAE